MPRYAIQPESFLAPNPFSPYLQVSFRLPFESRDPIYPASSLQLSFERSDDHQELFLARRLTAADVHHSHAGLCTLRLGAEHVPKYALKRRHQQDGEGDRGQQAQAQAQAQAPAPHVLVKLHAWKGDRHLGVWHVGQLRGDAVYEVVD